MLRAQAWLIYHLPQKDYISATIAGFLMLRSGRITKIRDSTSDAITKITGVDMTDSKVDSTRLCTYMINKSILWGVMQMLYQPILRKELHSTVHAKVPTQDWYEARGPRRIGTRRLSYKLQFMICDHMHESCFGVMM